MTLRIGLDARKIDDFGIGTYIRQLLPLTEETAALTLVNYVAPQTQTAPLHGPRREWHPLAAGKYSLRELFAFRRLARRDRLDVLHLPHYVVPFGVPCPTVVTVHDPIHVLFPQFTPGPHAHLYARWMMGRALRLADRVITGSETCKEDFVRLFGVDGERVRVIPYAPAPTYRSGEHEVCRQRAIRCTGEDWDAPYFFYAGELAPRKNVATALRAHHRACDGGVKAHFILAGERPGRDLELTRVIHQHGYPERLHFVGKVSHTELVELYCGAVATVVPSLYEGFGLPAVESMACGTPVIASDGGALPEVVGDSGLIFPAKDISALVRHMDRITTEPGLREELVGRARERVRGFSWERHRALTLEVYKEAVGRS